MKQLTTYHLLFNAKVVTPLELDDHSGSALRGNLYEAVWTRFCTNKSSATCFACELHTICPVSALVAPLREENARGRDAPRPYLILPPLGAARRYEPGSTLSFGMTLFGSIVDLLPYIMLSIRTLEAAGLGRRVVGPGGQGGQRGRFVVSSVESYHPFSGERQTLYEKGRPVAGKPALAVTSEDVRAKAASLSTDRLTLTFLTPTRLVDQERLVHRAEFRPLIQRLMERQLTLEETYGSEGPDAATTSLSSSHSEGSRSDQLHAARADQSAHPGTTPSEGASLNLREDSGAGQLASASVSASDTAGVDPLITRYSPEDSGPSETKNRRADIQRLMGLAEAIECVDDATIWDDFTSYSRRLKRSTPVGGLLGRATFAGDLRPFREMLVWGELIHVGKSCVKGNGWYAIESQT